MIRSFSSKGAAALADDMPVRHLKAIERPALRLGRYFRIWAEIWLDLQSDYARRVTLVQSR